MNRYKHKDTGDILSYDDLRILMTGFILPRTGTILIADVWQLIIKTEKPEPADPLTHGVREVVSPSGIEQEFEEYPLSAEKKAENQLEADALAAGQIESDFEEEIRTILNEFSATEQRMFGTLEAEAIAWDADPMAETIMIDAVISESAEIKSDYVALIISKINPLKIVSGKALGKKRFKQK